MSEPLAPSFDPDERVLCPDESCIGILDSDGRCKECGRQGEVPTAAAPSVAAWSTANLAELAEVTDLPAPVEPRAEPATADEPALPVTADLAAAESDDFADRELCADSNCIGVLDVFGICKECGRSAAPAPTAPPVSE